ncbi:TonB-dependent receptor [Mucilaginibacter roseus]|uniref:TonB-dependent receptor n=1 Tax=Mucilaginibacter roseus TaxID=1528868 RepID=A0ABS8U676_9SPHI|nr:TonB-dependent receptor [Mucilaginibacter roseus]MCD8741558.1 TonB-dependent receptor [Mucilaginibacter roseus]
MKLSDKTFSVVLKTALINFALFFALMQYAAAQENQLVEISGKVTDNITKEALPGVSVTIKGTVSGTTTNAQGRFSLRGRLKFPFTLVFSSVGFKTQEFAVNSPGTSLDVSLSTQSILGNEVVVSASRVEESILKSPVAIEKLDVRALKESPAPSFYDALENVKGVQLTTSSLTFKVPNTRGFNIPNNFRFKQLVDGIDMEAATLGVPLGNAIGPTELDIASLEVIPGAASALYGMNAINGMASLQTKNPFYYQGLSVYVKNGINHVGGTGRDLSNLTETAVRYAKAFNNKFAFKVNVSYLRGTDWVSDTRRDQNPNNLVTANPNYPELAANNPAYDGWNKYGDESNNAVTVSGINYNGKAGQSFIVRRTGYNERDIVSPIVDNLKIDGSLHYKVASNAELSYGYRFGKMDGVFQRGNKIQLDNVVVQNHKLELKGADYFVRTYMSVENSGDSYNVKPMADNLDIVSGGTNAAWGAKFKTALQTALDANTPLADAMVVARTAADAGRVIPGTPEFADLKSRIRGVNNWDYNATTKIGGAALIQKSRTYHADAQYDFTDKIKWFNLLVGADFREYSIIPDGNNFVDFSRPIAERNQPLPDGSYGNNVHYTKVGAFAQITKTFFEERLKIFGSLRLDYNKEFDPKLNPRIAAVYTLAEKHNFRVSYQNGFRFPALFEALSFVNNGNVRRIGGLPYINKGLNYLDNSYTLASINNFNAAVNTEVANSNGTITRSQSALNNRNLLKVTDLGTTQPEQINSFEAGYKALLFDNKVVLDIDGYLNKYTGFLGQVEVAVPYQNATDGGGTLTTQAQVGSDQAVIAALAENRNAQQTRYRVYTNAKNTYTNYGSSLGLTYNFYKRYTVSGNLAYNNIKGNESADIFVTGFNTPKWVTNVSLANREVVKNVGFNVVYRYQNSFLWESPLANGIVPAINTFDAQVSYKVPTAKATIKLGGSNIFNRKYYQYAAGPTIGGLYYIAVTFDGLDL